jgi:hypothetical protein
MARMRNPYLNQYRGTTLEKYIRNGTNWQHENMGFWKKYEVSRFFQHIRDAEEMVGVFHKRAVARIPFRSLKRLFDQSKARFSQFPNSPCGLKQQKLLLFHFAKNDGLVKSLNSMAK